MPPEPRQVPVSPQLDAARRRLHIHGIKEMPAGYDAEVAELFRDLRAASTLTEMELATRLATRVEVVQALEQGALYALPPWPETCRVVNAYGALLNLDVRPLLRRIYAQLEAGIVELRPKAIPDVPVMTPPESVDFGFEPYRGAPAASPFQTTWPNSAPTFPAQNPWPAATPSPAPQAPRPNAAPSPFPQSWPESAPPSPPQAPWPTAAPSRPAAPQPPQDRRAPPPPPRPAQAQAQAPQPQPQLQQKPPRQPAQPQPPPPRRDPAPAAAPPAPVAQTKRRRPALLKWGVVALILSVMAFGLWMVLGKVPGPPGASPGAADQADRALDPDDPRSRKADRLPSPF